MAVTIERVSQKKLDHILYLVQAYHEYEGITLEESALIVCIKRLMTDETVGAIWFVLRDTDIVGYLAVAYGFSIEFGGKDAFLDEFFILPEYRHQGIGSSALNLVIAELKNVLVRALHLEVDRSNKFVKKLYAKANFVARDKYMLMTNTLSI